MDLASRLAQLLREFDCTTGTVHALAAGLLHLRAQQGLPPFLLAKVATIPVGKGMAGIAAERREPVQICNLQTDESGVAKPSARETKVAGSITVPIFGAGGELRGTLGIAKTEPHEFSAAETTRLLAAASELCALL